MKITAELDPKDEARLKQAMSDMIRHTREPVEEILRQQGRLFAVDAAEFSQRFGNTAAAGRQHKQDVLDTIDSTYLRPLTIAKIISKNAGEPAGRRFSNYVRRRNQSKAQAMVDKFAASSIKGRLPLVDMWDGGKAHHKRIRGGGLPHPLIIMDYTNVTKYKREKIKQVGEAKAGWAKAAEDLGGTRGIPAYAKKNHKTKGRGAVIGRGSNATLTVTNFSNYARQILDAPQLWKLRTKNMQKVIERMLRKRNKKSTSKLR